MQNVLQHVHSNISESSDTMLNMNPQVSEPYWTKSYTVTATLVVALFLGGWFYFESQSSTRINVSINTNPDLERGLVGHWTFDGADITSDQVLDRSGGANHGGFFGGATTSAAAAGAVGQAFSFDGVNDYVEVMNESNFDFEIGRSHV